MGRRRGVRRTDIRAGGEYVPGGHGRHDELTTGPPGPTGGPGPGPGPAVDEVAPGVAAGPVDIAGPSHSAGPTATAGAPHQLGGAESVGGDRTAGEVTPPVGDSVDRPLGEPPAAEIVPGPPGGVLDLGALAAVEGQLRAIAAAGIDHAESTGARAPRNADADRAMCAAASTVAAALWFDTLRVEDRVLVTPHAGPLLGAVHQVLRTAAEGLPPVPGAPDTPASDTPAPDASPPPGTGTWAGGAATTLVPAGIGGTGGATDLAGAARRQAPRATGAGNVGPTGTIWSALAGRFAGTRFDRAPHGRQICLIDFAELRDSTVWEAVTDERVSHLGELFWVVLVTGAVPGEAAGTAGIPPGGVGSPARAARMFEAAGWQVLTLRYGRRLSALFGAPGGVALRARLDAMAPAEYLSLLHLDGPELRRRLAGPGAAGIGVSRLLDGLTDDEIHAALRDLGGHDLPLIIDAFDEVAADRPTVLFAYTGPLPGPPAPRSGDHQPTTQTPGPARETAAAVAGLPTGSPGRAAPPAPPAGSAVPPGHELVRRSGDRSAAPLPVASSGGRLARHVASYLDRAPLTLAAPAPLPAHTGHPYQGFRSTQEIFGTALRELPALVPEAASAVVTISTRNCDRVLRGWIDDAAGAVASGRNGPAADGGRHVAGGLSASAFGGVLASLGVAWSRLGLPLLPIGVADEMAVPRVLPGWASSGAGDGRSLLAVADTGVDPARPGGWRHGQVSVPGITGWEPAFAQDLVWCLFAALDRLGRVDGASSLIRLSARPVDQRLAALPTDTASWWRRRAAVLAGGYRLRSGEPTAPVTLVGMGAVMPEVLRAADELSAGLRQEIGVVCVTSPDLLFDALQARRGLADADEAILAELFPPGRRGPLLTVVDGDPRALSFLAGVHGAHITTLGSAAPGPASAPAPPPPAGERVPVDAATIVGAALDLIDEAADS
ncbi:pyruvate dehydrogenase [Parafrankia colletiae]|uniref:Pyruvate dehydrogenase n=1 Tax=Parafrankia colletiae TaxID=573497 RepID=A0A1S1RIZ5_9ACTN|nr:pyruvate dehydrogenase [Parafrankia colletiae]MCK9902436.1 pyruvate dehydrogenase [Frankia sp. Cpl3]OHV46180.1 pyruvate dehydrogenase [Parafrankia colletiae]